jgi:hypothetical protein
MYVCSVWIIDGRGGYGSPEAEILFSSSQIHGAHFYFLLGASEGGFKGRTGGYGAMG